jgi:2-polyprenyl-6-methoxyphenol hydroxylase-like FAD-dependent oxidoreductase
MSNRVGREAVVIGASMGGLAMAGALSKHFDHVTVLERDVLSAVPEPRRGTPQARHAHALLLSGQRALEQLFPGFEQNLESAGAVRLRAGVDFIWERPGYDPFPIRDLGFDTLWMSRPLLDFVCRRFVASIANVDLLPDRRVAEIVVAPDRQAVDGVVYEDPQGRPTTLRAELVVDASGRGALTFAALERLGLPRPEETEIGIDLGYASAVFEIPEDAPTGWKGLVHVPAAPHAKRGGFLSPMEGNRWLCSLGGYLGDAPPGDEEGFMAFVKSLRTSTIYDAIRHARRVGDISRFSTPASVRRHFEKLAAFPRGLVATGDLVCRFNPLFAHGMSVAALEALALDALLERRSAEADPLDGLGREFFDDIQGLLATPWSAAESDFAYRETRGQRPADLGPRFAFSAGLLKLAAIDPSVHRTMVEVTALLKPTSVLREPAIAGRVMQLLSSAT